MYNISLKSLIILLLIAYLFVIIKEDLSCCFNRMNRKRHNRLLDCNAGEMLTYDHRCEKCKKGFYNFSRENKMCLPCPLGTFSDKLGSVICTNCPNGSTTHATGSKSKMECICNKGFKLDPDDNKCAKCSTLEFCDGTENVWSFMNMCRKEKREEYVELCNKMEGKEIYNFNIFCFKEGVCLNFKEEKSCLDGNKLIQCKICDENYRYDFISPMKSPCVYCSFPSYLATCYFIIVVLFINIIRVLCVNSPKETRLISVFIKYMQYISLLRYVHSNYSHYSVHVLYLFTIGIPLNEILDCLFTLIKRKTYFYFITLLAFFLGGDKQRQDFEENQFYATSATKKCKNTPGNEKKGKCMEKCTSLEKDELASYLFRSKTFTDSVHISHLKKLGKKNKRCIYIDLDEIYSKKQFCKYFLLFFLYYHDFLYFEIIKLCIFFSLCNYDEYRKESFIIFDDSLECSYARNTYYVKIMIIVIYSTLIKFMINFLLLFKKFVKSNVPILNEAIMLYKSIDGVNSVDNIFLLSFLVLFYKHFWFNLNPYLMYNHKNVLYNPNIHTFQFVIITVLFFIYIMIVYLYVFEGDYVKETELNGEVRELILPETGLVLSCSGVEKIEREEGNVGDNADSCYADNGNVGNCYADNGNLGNCYADNGNTSNGGSFKRIPSERTRGSALGSVPDGIQSDTRRYFEVVREGLLSIVPKIIKKRREDKCLFYFTLIGYITILLTYYTFLSYVHLSSFLSIMTIISIACNCTVYLFVFLLFVSSFWEEVKSCKKFFFLTVSKGVEKIKLLYAHILGKEKITTLEEGNHKNVHNPKLTNIDMEEHYILKNKKRSIKLMNNILINDNNNEKNFTKDVNNLSLDNNKKIDKDKTCFNRHNLLHISKIWISFLYDIVHLSDKPEVCLSMLINLTLHNNFPNGNLEYCLKVLKKNFFVGMKNVKIILMNFLKYRDTFFNILRKNKNIPFDDYESLIIFSWGMSSLSYCNLEDINYNLCKILFHVSNILKKCRYFRNATKHYLASVPFSNVFSENNMKTVNPSCGCIGDCSGGCGYAVQEEALIPLISEKLGCTIQELLSRGQQGTQKGEIHFDVSFIYARELCRIYIHCLLLDVSELYFNIHYKYTCDKYLCSNLLNLWGYNISNNLYMQRYLEYVEKWKIHGWDLYPNGSCFERGGKYRNGITPDIFHIPDYINRNVLDIDFYHIFENLDENHKNYLLSLIKEGDYLHVNDLIDFAEACTSANEVEVEREKIEKEKKREIFYTVFSNASPVFIEKSRHGYLDTHEIRAIEERKRKFTIFYENMGNKYASDNILKSYEQKRNYFQLDSYGAVISAKGDFANSTCGSGKMLKMGEGQRNREQSKNRRGNDDLLNSRHARIINKNENNYTNYEHGENGQIGVFIHNNYECNVGVTGDLKGINLSSGNSLIVIDPPIVLPNECTIELWLFFEPWKENKNKKIFLFCDKMGNSLFVIHRGKNKIEDIEIYVTERRMLSKHYKRRYRDIVDVYLKRHHSEKRNFFHGSNPSSGIYVKSEKTNKWWKKNNKVVKINKWNLVTVTKSPSGLVYYFNGKYLARITHEVLNLSIPFEVTIFGNSCFGNNNIGLYSSFKIFDFLNKEEIKRRYKLIKNIKCKEIIGDNIKMERENYVIEGIDIRNSYPLGEDSFIMYFVQSMGKNARVVPFLSDSSYKLRIYQLKFFTKYDQMGDYTHRGKNIQSKKSNPLELYSDKGYHTMERKRSSKNENMDRSKPVGWRTIGRKSLNIIDPCDENEYGYNVYIKKLSEKCDVPKIYGINIFSDDLALACDLSKFYGFVLVPPLSIYNELAKLCGYTISAWVFLPIQKNISFSSLISGEMDVHICIFSDNLVIGCIENYNKKKEALICYHSSGYTIKNMKKGWYYLNVVGTLKGQFYFVNGSFKGYHKFCSFDNIKYIGNSSLFINPFPYICFLRVVNKPLSINEILYEYNSSPLYSNFTYAYYYHYLSSFFMNTFTKEENNNKEDFSSSDNSTLSYSSGKKQYVHFDVTKNYNVHIYPYQESKNYYFSLSLTSIINKKLYIFNSIKEQVNNLNIHLNNGVVLPKQWVIFSVINFSHFNKSSYHCLVGGEHGNSHVAIDGSDLSLGVLTKFEDNLCESHKVRCLEKAQSGSTLCEGQMRKNPSKELLRENLSNGENCYKVSDNQEGGNNRNNHDLMEYKNCYQNFHSCGYNLHGALQKNILLTTRCVQNEQTFFINSHEVGKCQACTDTITCIGNCPSLTNEYLSPFGSYKFVRIIFEYVSNEQIREFYHSLHL
ncbi:conserved Plasmodium protein, unknown function [Plasmodium ovale]|uniref:Tyrosine-protein kinase ephrin type A/B receptor-like domain-containing protein n=1 Tax=Plasmodium ovale TaxID=36330 RepID=A0A1D3U7I9_PLAOA|nr:conserved Plasmodium protein, unknown function [Plasmodium ovale]